MPPSAGLSNFNGRPPRLPPLSLLQKFCFREPLRKTLTVFFTVTFRIFWGHRCILNLPCVLRTCSVSRSPSHQPSTSHHCVLCRWLGESSPTYQTLYFLMVNHYTMMKSQIEVKRYVFRGWAVALASLVVSTMAHLSYCQRLTTPNQTQRVINDLIVAGEFLFPLSLIQVILYQTQSICQVFF